MKTTTLAAGHHGPARPAPRALAALATAAALLLPSVSRAACPADGPALAAVPVEARIAFLRQRLDAERGPARRWTWIWGVTDGALAAGQLTAVPFTQDRGGRIVLIAGAATAVLGPLQMIFFPVIPETPAPQPGSCATLEALERAVARGARNQRLGSGPGAHIANFLLNGALGVAAGLAARGWRTGAFTFAVGFTLGEAQIQTQPTGLVRDLARYRAGDLN